jgi:transcription elongation factor Elf1
MRCTDTDSKGRIIFQTKQGTYFSLDEQELFEAVEVLQKVVDYVSEGDAPRRRIDSRRNY